MCGGDLPDWCSELVVNYKFLFPFPLRQHYFHCTAFGMGRAVQHLQAMQAAEGAAAPAADRETRELRLGRMSRQKVRPGNYSCAVIHHLRLLECWLSYQSALMRLEALEIAVICWLIRTLPILISSVSRWSGSLLLQAYLPHL